MTDSVLSGRARWVVVHGDCLEVLRCMPDACCDSLVTDPPGAIKFMGRSWDSNKGGRDKWIEWLEIIMREALRVLKPGAHGFVWALPRTSHWTALALEQAGFEIRDRVTHLFGTGFPKSLNISKAIDARLGTTDERQVVHEYTAGGNAGTSTAAKGGTYAVGAENSPSIQLQVTSGGSPKAQQWDGWGTALKPAAEDWWLVRKPLAGTIADNVLEHGCGALNIDACRLPTDWSERAESWKRPGAEKIAAPPGAGIQCHPGGRWPAHVVFSHEPECDARCVDGCAVAALDEQTGKRPGGGASGAYVRNNRIYGQDGKQRAAGPTYPDKGTNASTFFYCVKPGRAERELGLGGFRGSGGARNIHPTVKSIDLMRWLIRLITPSGGLVLDTFCGSGSTGMATVLEGCRFIGIELNDTDKEPFVRIALARIAHCADWRPPEQHDAAEPPRQGSLF